MWRVKKFKIFESDIFTDGDIDSVRDIIQEIDHELDVKFFKIHDRGFFHHRGLCLNTEMIMGRDGYMVVRLRLNNREFRLGPIDKMRSNMEEEFETTKKWMVENILKRISNMGMYVSYAIGYQTAHGDSPTAIEMTIIISSSKSMHHEFIDNPRYTLVE